MEKHLCHNITSGDQNKYSAPVPIIGLFIAGSSLVCLLFMIFDMIHAIRRRKFWLPCKWVSLNSVTLTLLSIAAKLPVDLTTPMPGVWDQLSKLTGTAFICVCMGYIMPSLGANSASENTTNMAALSIFVITVIVNICIQISTGVIFSFVPEHIIIMCFMFAMLNFLWQSTFASNMNKEIQSDRNTQVFIQGKGSLTVLQRLKLCYLQGYSSDLQLSMSNHLMTSVVVNIICSFCFVVVIQVLVRIVSGHGLRSCNGTSDYGWWISIILAIQILVILLASLITSYREFMGSTQIVTFGEVDYDEIYGVLGNSPFLEIYVGMNCCDAFMKFVLGVGFLISVVIATPVLPVYVVFKTCICRRKYTEPEGMQEYIELRRKNDIVISDWTLIKCVKEIQRWMSKVKAENDYYPLRLRYLPHLLSNTPPSSRSLEQLHIRYNFKSGNDVSCLYLVFLAKLHLAISRDFTTPLESSLREVFDIIRFVDSKINPPSFSNKKKQYLAKSMWKAMKGFWDVVPKREELAAINSELGRVHFIIAQLKTLLPPRFIWDELSFVMDFIYRQECTTVQELLTCMEQLFVDMVYIFLMQLPQAVCKELTGCPAEEYVEKVKLMLKFISQVEPLEGKVEWSFPVGCGITSLISTPASSTDDHDSTRRGNEDGPIVDAVGSNDGCNVVNNANDINEV